MDYMQNFKLGSIRKIEVTNFVTYTYAELYPGPYLNMIIGPNGTGKSTMVAAIILGLGGTPKIVGRGSKLSDYVKYNCTEATINLYLQSVNGSCEKVTREINNQNKSFWKINDRKVSTEELIQFTKKYQIQINNLCQFLPQDRVQDFAKLNKQELLKETQLALCRTDLLEKQQSLIQLKDKDKVLKKKISSYTTQLQEAQVVVTNLEAKVENLNKKKEYSRQLEGIERKITWMDYEDIRGQLTDIKKDQIKAQNICDKQRKLIQPIENDIRETKKQIDTFTEQNNKMVRLRTSIEASIQSNSQKLSQAEEKIEQIEYDKQIKIDNYQRIKSEKECLKKKLKDFEELKAAKEIEYKEKTNSKTVREYQQLNDEISEINARRDELALKRQRESNQIQLIEREIGNIESIREQRLNILRESKPDVYKAVMWLRQNKHIFKGKVYEPIMIELNVLESKNGRFFENVIPMRDRLAFICTSIEDVNEMMRQLRLKMGLSVNILHSNQEDLSVFKPSIPIEQLRHFGFYSYLNSLATAPPAVMHYLCKYYRLHNIPVGTDAVTNNYTKVPSSIKLFFSEKFRFNVRTSKYLNSSNIRQYGIKSDGTLSRSQDTLKLENMRGKCKDVQKKVSIIEEQVHTLDQKLQALKNAAAQIRKQMDEIKQLQSDCEQFESKIMFVKTRISQLKIPNDVTVFEAEAERKIQEVRSSVDNIETQVQIDKEKLAALLPKIEENNDRIDNYRTKIMTLENDVKENRRKLEEDEQTLEKIKETYRRTLANAKEILNKAKALSRGFMPNEDGFDEFRQEYDSLPSDIERLNVEKEKIISLIDCLNTANEEEMAEYEAKLKLIEELEKKLENANKSLGSMDKDVQSAKRQWLEPLQELIGKINEKFSSAFARIGCAGEVSIDPGENEMDFSQYGISIKVSYRNGMPLQQLNRTVQSGGERAVATAAFMLSLQELTPVPFRCVDEINQGMDINNERRIFELLVEATSQSDTSQYFLITPKLATKLSYPPTAVIHFVHNGPFVRQNNEWSNSPICNPLSI